MGEHLSKFVVYYLFLNIIVIFFAFSNVLIKGIIESEKGVYECIDIASNVNECSFGEFLLGTIFMFWVIFFFIQPFLFFSSLISYLIFIFLKKKIKEINEINFYFKFLIFFFINLPILIPLFIVYRFIASFSE